MYVFDAHQDIADALLYASHGNFWKRNGLHEGWNDMHLPVNNQSDFVRLITSNIKAVFGVSCAFATDSKGNIIPSPNHLHETLKQINIFHKLLAESKGKVQIIRNKKDLNSVKNFKLSFLLAIEGADSIDENLVNLETFFNLGVRSIGLTWSFNNVLAGGCNGSGSLTRLGKKVIKRMQQLGIILDLSHLNDKSAHQAIDASTKPVIISHTASMSVYEHPRNVSDDLMKKVSQTGGAVGICGVPKFIGSNPNINDVVKHFEHTINLIGIKHVIIGTDFGSMTADKLIPDYQDVTEIPHMIDLLVKKLRLTKNDVEDISHRNLERILSKTLPNT